MRHHKEFRTYASLASARALRNFADRYKFGMMNNITKNLREMRLNGILSVAPATSISNTPPPPAN